jgi:hypothetical protein
MACNENECTCGLSQIIEEDLDNWFNESEDRRYDEMEG